LVDSAPRAKAYSARFARQFARVNERPPALGFAALEQPAGELTEHVVAPPTVGDSKRFEKCCEDGVGDFALAPRHRRQQCHLAIHSSNGMGFAGYPLHQSVEVGPHAGLLAERDENAERPGGDGDDAVRCALLVCRVESLLQHLERSFRSPMCSAALANAWQRYHGCVMCRAA
jgi:hypothetical protein